MTACEAVFTGLISVIDARDLVESQPIICLGIQSDSFNHLYMCGYAFIRVDW
jgi:hypothetical protein